MREMRLSPIDHIFTGSGSYPIEFAFAYRGKIDVDRLRSSFQAALDHFPPARSKLVRTSADSYAFQSDEDGARFETIDSPSGFDDSSRRYEFLDPVDSVESEPLTRVRLTLTPDGPVLGVSMSHAVVDGFSYFHFLSTWARLFHGKRTLDPFHGREILIPEQVDDRRQVTPRDVENDCGIFWGTKRTTIDRASMTWDRRMISKEEMNQILRRAQKECDVRLSHNDVVTALLWKEYIARWDAGDQDTPAYVSCPVDFRRVLPRCPPNYFGCAVSLATTSLPRGKLGEASISELAAMVRSAVARVNDDYISRGLSTLERLRRQQGLAVLEENHVIHPRAGLLVTNLSRLPVQNVEFDGGPPIAFDILTPAHRGAVILPTTDGIDVRVCYNSPRRS